MGTLKISSAKWKFTLDYDITQVKQDIRESGPREKHPEPPIYAAHGSEDAMKQF
jgi:hypothetical protein